MAAQMFPDNTVLCNFAAVGRLDLLEEHLRGRGRWTEAVAYEWSRSAGHYRVARADADLAWLGDPIEIEQPALVDLVERVRRRVFGGAIERPLQHLGEAQTCLLLSEVPQYQGSFWVSDDRDALEYARGRGLLTRDTLDLFQGIVADGDLPARPAYDLIHRMHAQGRALRLPRHLLDLG